MFVLQLVVGLAFLAAGAAKLAGAKPLADQFREFGLPSFSMRLIGALEVAGAVGLFVTPVASWAASGLALLMVGAVGSHRRARHGLGQTAPSLVLLILTAWLAVGLWGGP